MNFDYKSFELELKEKTRSTFIGCTEKLDIKDIAGFALYSDNSAMTMSVSCNTYEHLKKLQNETPGHDIYFKWTPGEWRYELINAKEFKHLCDLLRDAHFDKTTGIFSTHRNRIYSTAVKVLEEFVLDKNKERLFVFATGREDEWTLKFLINEESTKPFFRKTEQYLEVTDNVLHVVSWSDLNCTLQFTDTTLSDKFNKELKVKIDNGLYRVVVKQLFDPEDYEYDAENKINFIVEFFSVESTNKNKIETIAWTENFPNDDTAFLSEKDSDTSDFLEKLLNDGNDN